MTKSTQVSAYISEETKIQVEAYVRRHGVKKAYLIEVVSMKAGATNHPVGKVFSRLG